MKIIRNQDYILVRCLKLFSRKDLRRIGAVVIIQMSLSVLDLVGVALIGVIGALAVPTRYDI